MKPPENMVQASKRIRDIIQRFDPPRPWQAMSPQGKVSEGGVDRAGGVDPAGGENTRVQAAGSRPGQGMPLFRKELEGLIQKYAKRHRVSPDLIRAVIRVESGGRKDAVSPAGALGLMQLMPGTAKALGVNPRDPEQNIDGGVRYLKNMAHKFGDLDLTLAAYNAGPGAVRRHGGVPPYRETRNYIKKIRAQLQTLDASSRVDFRR